MAELQNMPTYLTGARSKFPNELDSISEKRDLPPNKKTQARRFQELINKENSTSAEQQELNNLTIELYDYIVTAEDRNMFGDVVIATQRHYRDNTINHVNQLKQETTDYVNAEKQSISNIAAENVNDVIRAKDDALLAIERKKEAIIEFLNSTEVGALRVDLGVMADLETEDNSSLVNAVNEVNRQVNSVKYSPPITTYDNTISLPENTVKGQVSGSVRGLTATNIIKNGNFSNGTTNWTSTSNMNVVNNELQFIPTGQYGNVYQQIKNINISDKLYIVAKIKTNKNTVRLSISHKSGYTFTSSPSNDNNEFGRVSVIGTIPSDVDYNFIRLMVQDIGTTFSTIYIKEVMAINLTQIFGAGNEPTKEECDKIFANWFDGTKSTISAMRLKSVGINVFGGEIEKGAIDGVTGLDIPSTLVNRTKGYVKINPLLQYTFSGHTVVGGSSVYFYFYDINKKYISRGYGSKTSTLTPSGIPANTVFVRLMYNNNLTEITDKVQLEEGNISTPYTKYQEDISYIVAKKDNKIVNLKSLPNCVRDEINVSEGKVVLRTKTTVLNGSENWVQVSSLENTILFYLIKPVDWVPLITDNITSFINDTFPQIYAYAKDEEGTFVNSSYFFIRISKSKLITLNPTGFKQWLQNNPITLTYQLAQPEIIPINWKGLQAFENGTIYFDTVIPEVGFYYSNGLYSHYPDHPIKSVDVLYKVNKENGMHASLDVSKCVIRPDKMSFTHPDLKDGDLCSWDYISTSDSTNGEKTIIVPTNLKASVDSLLQDSLTQKNNIKAVENRVDNLSNEKMGKILSDQNTTAKYEFVVVNGRPYLKVVSL